LRVEVLQRLDDARVLAPAWRDLVTRSVERTPFVGPDWMMAWWEAFSIPGDRMHLITLWDRERLVGVAPLMLRVHRMWPGATRVLSFWHNPFSNRVTPIIDEAYRSETVDAIVSHLLELRPTWDRLVLADMPLAARTTTALITALRDRGCLVGVEPGHASPYLALPEAFADIDKALGRRFRETVRRKERAAAQRGLHVHLSSDPASLESVFSVCRGSWQHANGTGIGSTPEVRSFYQRIATSIGLRQGLQLALLMDGDTPIAFEYNLYDDGRVSNLKMGYRSTAGAHSPGLVLRCATIREAIRLGATEFDFLGAEDEHKLHWTKTVRKLGTVVVYSGGGLDRLRHAALYRARPWMRRRFPRAAAFGGRLRRIVSRPRSPGVG
jgi:CelD/BcsL family acetyltransferase involved in cellulose biosynthesis